MLESIDSVGAISKSEKKIKFQHIFSHPFLLFVQLREWLFSKYSMTKCPVHTILKIEGKVGVDVSLSKRTKLEPKRVSENTWSFKKKLLKI